MSVPKPMPIYVLAGGQGRRFGSDKARAAVGKTTLIERVASALAPAASSVTAVAQTIGAYQDLGLTTIADRRRGLGPLGGLAAALEHRLSEDGPGWIALTPCDWLNPDSRWLDALHAQTPRDPTPQRGGAVVFGDRQRVHPLPGLYHTTLLPLVSERCGSDTRSLWQLLEAAAAQVLAPPPALGTLEQANTPEQLGRWIHKNT